MLEGQRMPFHTFLSFLLFSFHGYLARDHWRPTNALMFFGPSINQSLKLRVDRKHKRSEDQSARSVQVTLEKDNFHLIDGAIGSEVWVPKENKQTGSQIIRLSLYILSHLLNIYTLAIKMLKHLSHLKYIYIYVCKYLHLKKKKKGSLRF